MSVGVTGQSSIVGSSTVAEPKESVLRVIEHADQAILNKDFANALIHNECALAQIRETREASDRLPELYLKNAKLNLRLGFYEKALVATNVILERTLAFLSPSFRVALNLRCEALCNLGSVKGILDTTAQLLPLYGSNDLVREEIETHLLRFRTFQYQGDTNSMASEYRAINRIFARLERSATGDTDYDERIEHNSDIISESQLAEMYYIVATDFYRNKNFSLAIDFVGRALRLNPGITSNDLRLDPDCHRLIALSNNEMALKATSDFDFVTKLIVAEKSTFDELSSLARLCQLSGTEDQLDIQPRIFSCNNRLIKIYLQICERTGCTKDNKEKAFKALTQMASEITEAYETNTIEHVAVSFSQASAYYAMKKYDEAMDLAIEISKRIVGLLSDEIKNVLSKEKSSIERNLKQSKANGDNPNFSSYDNQLLEAFTETSLLIVKIGMINYARERSAIYDQNAEQDKAQLYFAILRGITRETDRTTFDQISEREAILFQLFALATT